MNDLQRHKSTIIALAAQAGRDAVVATCKSGLPVTHAVNGRIATEFIGIDDACADNESGSPLDTIAT